MTHFKMRGSESWHYLQDGITETSAVTTLSRPRLDRAPLTTPHEKARYWEKTHTQISQTQSQADYDFLPANEK